MRSLCLASCVLLLSGCAIFQPSRQQAQYDAPTAISVDGALEPVALTAPRTADGMPVGLGPCAKKRFPANDCWRRGDQHVLFPPSIATAGMPQARSSVPVSEKR